MVMSPYEQSILEQDYIKLQCNNKQTIKIIQKVIIKSELIYKTTSEGEQYKEVTIKLYGLFFIYT